MFRKPKPKAFIIDDTHDGIKAMEDSLIPLNLDLETHGFTDAKKLLFSLHSKKNNNYKVGIIHENGSKYKPQILCQFIRKINPDIRLIICKDNDQLQSAARYLILT
jgi:hypothetical protein